MYSIDAIERVLSTHYGYADDAQMPDALEQQEEEELNLSVLANVDVCKELQHLCAYRIQTMYRMRRVRRMRTTLLHAVHRPAHCRVIFFFDSIDEQPPCLPHDAAPPVVGLRVGRRAVDPRAGCSNAGRRGRRARADALPCDALPNAVPTRVSTRDGTECRGEVLSTKSRKSHSKRT